MLKTNFLSFHLINNLNFGSGAANLINSYFDEFLVYVIKIYIVVCVSRLNDIEVTQGVQDAVFVNRGGCVGGLFL